LICRVYQRVSCLLSCSSKSHKIPPIMHQNSFFQIKNKLILKILGRGHSTTRGGQGRDPASFLDHFKHCSLHSSIFGHPYFLILSTPMDGGPFGIASGYRSTVLESYWYTDNKRETACVSHRHV